MWEREPRSQWARTRIGRRLILGGRGNSDERGSPTAAMKRTLKYEDLEIVPSRVAGFMFLRLELQGG